MSLHMNDMTMHNDFPYADLYAEVKRKTWFGFGKPIIYRLYVFDHKTIGKEKSVEVYRENIPEPSVMKLSKVPEKERKSLIREVNAVRPEYDRALKKIENINEAGKELTKNWRDYIFMKTVFETDHFKDVQEKLDCEYRYENTQKELRKQFQGLVHFDLINKTLEASDLDDDEKKEAFDAFYYDEFMKV